MKNLILSAFLLQTFTMQLSAQNIAIEEELYRDHHLYLEESIRQRRFKHDDLVAVLEKLKTNEKINIRKIGESIEGRSINLVRIGRGKTKVLLWSQMHGDESTATMALMDIFNFFAANDEHDGLKENISNSLSLYFVPMLNPDGAEKFQRRNVLGFDLNRDALRLEFAESEVLKGIADEVKADFGFNLHDQSTLYTAGVSGKPATISFLAPPYDYERSIDNGRLNAIKVISLINKKLQHFIPGQVAKYSDDFEPRAFGDNFQKWGTSTILVESGGYPNDPEKQEIRKLNFVLLISALNAIATKEYEHEKKEDYDSLPKNEKYLFDLLIREASYVYHGKRYVIDISYIRKEIQTPDNLSFYYKSAVEDLGDLSTYYGYEEIDATGMEIIEGKTCPELFDSIQDLNIDEVTKLLKQGFTEVRVKNKPEFSYSNLPISVLAETGSKDNSLRVRKNPNFLLKQKGRLKYAVINGFIFDLSKNDNRVKNGLVEKGW